MIHFNHNMNVNFNVNLLRFTKQKQQWQKYQLRTDPLSLPNLRNLCSHALCHYLNFNLFVADQDDHEDYHSASVYTYSFPFHCLLFCLTTYHSNILSSYPSLKPHTLRKSRIQIKRNGGFGRSCIYSLRLHVHAISNKKHLTAVLMSPAS